jgi:tetratricopeptide (TPR) repeat protein
VEVHAFPPTSPAELVDLARFFGLAGQPERARQLFERGEQEFGFSPGFWLAYADQLMETRQWAQASEWARRVRQHETVGDILLAFSYFVEGRAEAQLGREVSASDAFEKMKALEFPSPELAMRAASEVLNLGRAPVAAATLVRVEEALVHDPRYWALRFRVADAMRDVEAMVQAARRAYEMQPSNPLLVNNYAAALLIQRNNPDAAVRLTLQLFTATPGSLPAQINHAAALLLNGRLAEAEKILAGVATNGLSPGQMSFYAFDRFELAIRQNRLSEARNWLERVDEAALYPPQQAWLEEARKRMAAPEPRG